jgi:predicted transcriptional regulator
VGRRSFSTVEGDIKFVEAPESIRVGIAAWSLVMRSIVKRGDVLKLDRQTNSILVLQLGPIRV